MNLYGNLTDLQQRLGLASVTAAQSANLLELLEWASRAIDEYCGRQFYTSQAVRYFTPNLYECLIDDLLAATEILADEDGDFSYTRTLVEGEDYWLIPMNSLPKTILELARGADVFPATQRAIKITGTFGYGDNTANPWRAAGCTVTLSDAADVSAVLGTLDIIKPGQTLLVGTEQIYVESVTDLAATVRRGVNGTTAAAHAAAASSVAQYPASVARMSYWLASQAWNEQGTEGKVSERIGEYSYQRMTEQFVNDVQLRCLGPLRRISI